MATMRRANPAPLMLPRCRSLMQYGPAAAPAVGQAGQAELQFGGREPGGRSKGHRCRDEGHGSKSATAIMGRAAAGLALSPESQPAHTKRASSGRLPRRSSSEIPAKPRRTCRGGRPRVRKSEAEQGSNNKTECRAPTRLSAARGRQSRWEHPRIRSRCETRTNGRAAK